MIPAGLVKIKSEKEVKQKGNENCRHEPSSLFHHSVLVDLNVSMMMH